MGRFKKHLGEGKNVILGGEEFLFKPLTTDEAPLFFKLMKLSGKDGKGFDFEKMDEDTANVLRDIINKTLQKSFPEEWEKEQEETKSFGMKYLMDIFNTIIEINSPSEPNEVSKQKLDKLKSELGLQS